MGERLNTLSKVVLAIGIIGSLVGGIYSCTSGLVMIGVITIVAGFFTSFILFMILNGLGCQICLSEDILEIVKKTVISKDVLQKIVSHKEPTTTQDVSKKIKYVPVINNGGGKITCSACKELQLDDRETCWNCGAHFIK